MFFAPSKSRQRAKIRLWVYQRPVTISKKRSRYQTPVRNPQHPGWLQLGIKGRGYSLRLIIRRERAKFRMRVYQRPVTISKMPNPSQESTASSKSPNQDLKDMDVLCTFIIKIERQTWIIVVSKDSDHIQIKFKMPNPSLEPSTYSKSPNED